MTRPTALRAGASAGSVALVLGLGVAAFTGPASAADSTGCSTGDLPASVARDPGVKAGQVGGAYLYHDGVFHLRVTHATSKKLAVTVRLDATSFSSIQPVALERADTITQTGDGTTLILRFSNYGKIDGVDFSADCSKRLRVQVLFDGKQATTKQVKLGAHRVAPTSVPFVIERTAPAAS
ncbi:MAG: hypothetical protein JWO22_3843 [Frankiales bacterium]|nr:hypothetical protein [Frankiales bacterium]